MVCFPRKLCFNVKFEILQTYIPRRFWVPMLKFQILHARLIKETLAEFQDLQNSKLVNIVNITIGIRKP